MYPHAFQAGISIGKKLLNHYLTDLMTNFQVVLSNTACNYWSFYPFLSFKTNLCNDIGPSISSVESILADASSWFPCACIKDKIETAVITKNFFHMLQEDMVTVSIDTHAFKHIVVGIAIATIL